MIELDEDSFLLNPIEPGGVVAPQGFKAGGVHAGFKKKTDHLDLALIVGEKPYPTAGMFTKNTFCAAPVSVCRENLGHALHGYCQAVLINAGNANAATGKQGLNAARRSTQITAEHIGCRPEEVLVASTGVIGVPIEETLFIDAMEGLVSSADVSGGRDAAKAIMTTDTRPKEYAVSYISTDPHYKGIEFKIGGMVKGSGMIMPDMATMIAVLTTDAPLDSNLLHKALDEAVNVSFNKVTVDSDTSTNDSCFIMASGKAGKADNLIFLEKSRAYQEFLFALIHVCETLARDIAIDGEGATKLITVNISGAATDDDADKAARSVANSPLVKTAVFGHDANWGRVAMALGKSGATFKQEKVSIVFAGLEVCKKGLALPFDEEEALRRFKSPEIVIDIDLGAGAAETTIWTCDYSHDYITINGDYRT